MISVAPGGLVKDMVEHLRPVYKKDGIHIRGQIEAGFVPISVVESDR